jgi:hypothetical protein
MKLTIRILMSLGILLIFISCEKDPASTEETLEVEPIIEEQAAFGFEVNQIVKTGKEVSDLTLNAQFLKDNGLGTEDLSSPDGLLLQGSTLMQIAATEFQRHQKENSILADSISISVDDTLHGVRYFFSYDNETGLARSYEVKYDKFWPWQKKNYDSTEIVFDFNMTYWNGSDDKLKSIVNIQNFDSNFFIQSILSELIVTDYDEKEPTGVELQRDSYYKDSMFLQHLVQTVDINPDDSGTLREDFEFRDGSSAFHSVTFYPDQTGEFTKQLRNGITVSGTFDSAEDDNEGSWTETIEFPEGRYIDKILRSAEVVITVPDKIYEISLDETVLFSSGREESASIDIEVEEREDVKTTKIDVLKANGAQGSFTISETDEVSELDGQWYTWNQYYIDIAAEFYADGSGHILYNVYEPPYQEGNDPILVVDYYFSPDGSGTGNLVHNGLTYLIKFTGGDQAEISHGDKKAQFNVFQ